MKENTNEPLDSGRAERSNINRRSLLGAGAAVGAGVLGVSGFGSTTAHTGSSGSSGSDDLSDGRVMFFFDDGKESHPAAAEILEDYGFRGVFAIITGRVRSGSSPSISDFDAMQSRGHLIESHTVTHCNDEDVFTDKKKLIYGDDSDVRYELRESREWLDQHGYWTGGGSVIVYPRGGVDQRVADIARPYYTFGFGTRLQEPIFGWDDPLVMPRQPVQNLSETKSMIEDAGSDGGVVPIMAHSIVDNADDTKAKNDITPSQLRDVCETAQSNGVDSIQPKEFRNLVRDL